MSKFPFAHLVALALVALIANKAAAQQVMPVGVPAGAATFTQVEAAAPIEPPQPRLALAPRGVNDGSRGAANDVARPTSTSRGVNGAFTTLVGLSIVLGLFLLCAWMMKKAMPAGARELPDDVVEVLGRTPLAYRQQAHLIRLGRKLVLVSLAPGVAEPLAEIDDAAEVDRLLGLCRQARPNSATSVFRNVLAQMSRDTTRDEEGADG